ncbi:MAG: transglutaminase domain-containing protein [Methanoregula sp.]
MKIAKGNKQQKTGHSGKKFVIVGVILLLILVIVVIGLNISSGRSAIITMENDNAESIMTINGLIAHEYETEIYPQGKAKIDSELVKLSAIPDPTSKLNEIFVWEMKDWIDVNENLSRFGCINPACTYAVLLGSDKARLRASPFYDGILYPQENPNRTMYGDDPYWIAYNMVGDCREYSHLFSSMAAQSGIDSRIVRTNSHEWVEVQLNNESYYYDPWCAIVNDYYNATDGNMTYEDKWFNRIGYFEENCHPPDGYLISYDSYPWVWATPKYQLAYQMTAIKDIFK